MHGPTRWTSCSSRGASGNEPRASPLHVASPSCFPKKTPRIFTLEASLTVHVHVHFAVPKVETLQYMYM